MLHVAAITVHIYRVIPSSKKKEIRFCELFVWLGCGMLLIFCSVKTIDICMYFFQSKVDFSILHSLAMESIHLN
jgi:hypothetical protein